MVIEMNYKTYVYIVSVLLSTLALSGINYNNFFKKGKIFESRLTIVLFSLALGYLVGSFVITFIEVSKII